MNQLGISPTFFLLAIFFCFSLFISNSAYSQGSLQSFVRVRVKKGNAEGSQIVLFKDGTKVGTFPTGRGGKFEVRLDYDADYIFSFEKTDFVTKKININTQVPSTYPKEKDNIIDFEVELEPQVDMAAIKVYDNPVGRIRFDHRKNDFGYDVDYSASFQKKVREEEKKIAEENKQKEAQKEQERIAEEAEQRKQEQETQRLAQQEALRIEQEKQKKEAEARALAEARERKKKENLKRNVNVRKLKKLGWQKKHVKKLKRGHD